MADSDLPNFLSGFRLQDGSDVQKIRDRVASILPNPLPWFTQVTERPSPLGNWDSVLTAFDGDIAGIVFPVKYEILGSSTLGSPTVGYLYTPEAYPHVTYLYNASGHNESTSTNTGRTAAVGYRTYVYQAGQGDGVAYNASVFVTGARAGASNFLANPAGVIINGDMSPANNGVYLSGGEFKLSDGGFDVAGVGWVVNLVRTNDTGALDAYWAGFRIQSQGSKAVNDGYAFTGKAVLGLNLSWADFGAGEGAIGLKADQRLYGNVTGTDPYQFQIDSLGTEYITYESSLSGWDFVVGNNSILQIVAGQITATKPIRSPSSTVAALPAVGLGGRIAFASNGRKNGEGAGLGTGVLCFSDGTNWIAVDSGTPVQA